ncbi:MAG: anthranilate synthase component I, partial [Candidatus Methanoperedens sp.]|nr:anthranilate synthase component I [Candidatus Methanoperedens sp.]
MEFDISESDFISLAEEKPVIIQLMAKVHTECSPLDLYAAMDKKCAYLLESVEKEKKHARFSFVGALPDAVITIKNRILTLDYTHRTNLIKLIESSLLEVCDSGKGRECRLKAGFDTMDAIRAAFAASRVKFIGKSFDRQTFLGGAIGFCAYDMVYDCWLDIPPKKSNTPDAQFALTTKTVVFDHLTDEAYIVITPFVMKGDAPQVVYQAAKADAEKLAIVINNAHAFVSKKNEPAQIT